ncbi:GNAT family N-acetyltransferase [Halorarius halobius]|uniref:GNAT family N-acetyltransferase n=1 Tax=Halorarius halobius TaxID=2962671 RepID=UPI0020CB81EA|nr:GNAT family protein [Halorarius halobius]
MPGPAFRTGEAVALHTVEEDDLEFLKRLRNDPEIRHGMTFSRPENETAIEEWFEEHVSETTGEGAQFLVCPRDAPGDPVGFVSLFDVERPESHGDIAYFLDPDERGNGYATAAVELLVGYAIEEQRLHRVHAVALAGNEASRRVLERVGFVEEETRRAEKLVDGEFRDAVSYSILAEEWGDS